MRLGADPVQLERLSASWRSAAVTIQHTAVRVASVDRRWWQGPDSRRWYDQVDHLARQLRIVTDGLRRGSAELLDQSEQQRRASLDVPSASVQRFDPVGDGRWVARVGSPDAQAVVALVPGVGTTVRDRERLERDAQHVWTWLAGHAERIDRIGAGGAERVAVVAWLGYDPPDHVVAGLWPGAARTGGDHLALDVAMWRERGAGRVVLVGHSYGGLVAAEATAGGAAPDELVLLGAPGIGRADPLELGLAEGAELWAAAARGDVISWVARSGRLHGADPMAWGRPLPTSTVGHGGYLRDPDLLGALAELTVIELLPGGVAGRGQLVAPRR